MSKAHRIPRNQCERMATKNAMNKYKYFILDTCLATSLKFSFRYTSQKRKIPIARKARFFKILRSFFKDYLSVQVNIEKKAKGRLLNLIVLFWE